MPRKLPPLVREQVRLRAGYLCEYCHTDERWQLVPFTVDHVLPVSLGGADTSDNLALACFHSNRRKSDKQAIFDRTAAAGIPLFNPRRMSWAEHFIWSADGLRILPQTPIGEATIELLELNRPRIIRIRQADVLVNRHPPGGDGIKQSQRY